MVEQDADPRLTALLRAVADPTRRAILTLLVQHGALRVTHLAAHFRMSLNAVSKHIRVLEEAGLVSRRKEWRKHLIEANTAPLRAVADWMAGLRLAWDVRLESLERSIARENSDA